MVMSDFRSEVEIRPFHACAIKNTQYNPYLWPNCPNYPVISKIGVEEHDVDIRFFTGSGNTAVCACAMHPAIIIGTARSLWT